LIGYPGSCRFATSSGNRDLGGGNGQFARPKKRELEPFAFEADLGDHCETPGIAYRHITPLLREIATAKFPDQHWRVASKHLQIYDPYYCQGGVKQRLARLGFDSVYNENEDFYTVCEEQHVPKFDVLVTNPPFSAEKHFSFILEFVVKTEKPWFLILPVKEIFRDLFVKTTRTLPSTLQPFFLAPPKKYNFKTPSPLPPPPTENRAKARSRSRLTHTLWVAHGGTESLHKLLLKAAQDSLCTVAERPGELPKEGLPGDPTEEMRRNIEAAFAV